MYLTTRKVEFLLECIQDYDSVSGLNDEEKSIRDELKNELVKEKEIESRIQNLIDRSIQQLQEGMQNLFGG